MIPLFIFSFFSLQILIVNMRVLPLSEGVLNTTKTEIVEETQHAICKISTKDLDATANATITRQLKGVATTSHLDDRMNILEKTVILEMNNIKQVLEQFVYLIQKTEHNLKPQQQLKNKVELKELKHNNNNNNESNNLINRDSEISNLNMTIQKDNSSIKFLYYWKIDNFVDLLSATAEHAVESGDFYFAGNHLFIRLIPNYLQSEHCLIEVIEIEQFHLSHKFRILDQENPQFDKTSETLYCGVLQDMEMQCATYEVSHQILFTRNYIKNKSIIIQLVIYLDY